MNKLVIPALGAVIGLSTITSANAFPDAAVQTVPLSEFIQVSDHGHHGGHVWHGHHNGHEYGRRYGYHDHDGNAGAIIGGLAAGAIIGGVLSSHSTSHAQYCYDRYQTYRASDNTFVSN